MRGTLAMTTVFGLAALAGCGSEPADVAGTYTISVTNRDNGCSIDGWVEGESASNIMVTMEQNGESVSATVGGSTGNFLDFALGSHVFVGSIDGNDLDLRLMGENYFVHPPVTGNCDYTYDAILDGNADGDVLTGTINYAAQTDGASDCAGFTGCVNVQEFNGTRPPT